MVLFCLPLCQATPAPWNHAKSGLVRLSGREKVVALAARLDDVLAAVPYVQVNLMFGLDGDDAEEPFELTRDFVRRCPGVWPNLNLFTVFGSAAPSGRRVLDAGQLLGVPFCLLDQKTCLNVTRSAGHARFFANLVRLSEDVYGGLATLRRVGSASRWKVRGIHAFRALGAEERQRILWYRQLASWLEKDRAFRSFFQSESTRLPEQLRRLALERLGPFRALLPPGRELEYEVAVRR